MNLFLDDRIVIIDELFNNLKSRNGITYLKVCETPVMSKSIKFISSKDINETKEIIREHLTEARYYSYFEIWKNI